MANTAIDIYHFEFPNWEKSEKQYYTKWEHLTLCMQGNFACFIVVCSHFLKLTFQKIFQDYMHLDSASSNLDPDQAWNFSGLIWVQTVCKVYLPLHKVGVADNKDLNKFKLCRHCMSLLQRRKVKNPVRLPYRFKLFIILLIPAGLNVNAKSKAS